MSHEISPEHFKCMSQYFEAQIRLKGENLINQEMMKQIFCEGEHSGEVLWRLVEIILCFAENNIAFHGTKLFTKNNGNFLGLVQFLRKFYIVSGTPMMYILSADSLSLTKHINTKWTYFFRKCGQTNYP